MKGQSIFEGLMKFYYEKPVSFHTPGHKWGKAAPENIINAWGREIFKFDHTEVSGLDNLGDPCGIIKESMEGMNKIFNSNNTYFLVNGATCGVHSMLTALKIRGGKKILFQRDSHMSAYWGLVLTGLEPIYIYPEIDYNFNIPVGVSPDNVEDQIVINSIDGVFITSPNYYGIASCKRIIDITSRYSVSLLVDEAHGSHFYFSSKLPHSFQKLGADLVTHSCHKNLSGLTQTGLLHCNNVKYNQPIKQALRFLMSSSPSYLFLMSIESAINQFSSSGEMLIDKAISISQLLKSSLIKKGIKVMEHVRDKREIDPTKVVINLSQINNIIGLLRQNGVEGEFYDGNNIVLIITAGNEIDEINKTVDIFTAFKDSVLTDSSKEMKNNQIPFMMAKPQAACHLREAFFSSKSIIKLKDAKGRIAGDFVIPYPPGIPILVPGEIINQEIIDYILSIKKVNIKILGINNDSILVLEDK